MAFDGFPSYIAAPRARVEYWREFLRNNPTAHATMDFETRSACDLRRHGSWIYSKHPSTQALCLAYHLPDSDDIYLWHREHHARTPWNEDAPEQYIPETPPPYELFAFIEAGGLVEAHNMMFERVIWTHVMQVQHDWPSLPVGQLRCSASRASYASLPRSLEMAAKAMALPIEKDMDGRKLMLKMTKPRKPRKAEVAAWKAHLEEEGLDPKTPHPIIYHEVEESIYGNHAYCEQDVRTEMAFSEVCPELEPRELELWQLDQEMNWRGVQVDLDLAKIALQRAAEWKEILNAEFEEITGIAKASQRQKAREWLAETGLNIPDTTAATIDWYLDHPDLFTDERQPRVLEIIKQVNRTSVRKFQAMLDKTDPEDGRARDLLMYHGASTGRWSGKGIQVQNFPRGNSVNKTSVFGNKEYGKFDMDRACDEIKSYMDTSMLALLNGDVMELLSSSLRGGMMPRPGHDMIVADYSAIEARCVLWEAGAEKALEVFRTGGDIYCDMAEGIYGYPVNKKENPDERQFGKQAILGLGYGMGFITFLLTCKKYKIDFSVAQVKKIVGGKYDKYMGWLESYLWPKPNKGESAKDFKARSRAAKQNLAKLKEARLNPVRIKHELVLMKYTVDVYRTRYPEVKKLWKDQEEAAMQAVLDYEADLKAALAELDLEDFLEEGGKAEQLRRTFEGPRIDAGCTAWFVRGGFLCCELPSGRLLRYRDPFIKMAKTSWGEEKPSLRYYTTVVGGRWARTSTYGGKIVENITQAVARDVMADAMLKMRDSQYIPLMTVHDELVCEVPTGEGDVDEFERLMCDIGPWAEGCPIAAEGDLMARYRK